MSNDEMNSNNDFVGLLKEFDRLVLGLKSKFKEIPGLGANSYLKKKQHCCALMVCEAKSKYWLAFSGCLNDYGGEIAEVRTKINGNDKLRQSEADLKKVCDYVKEDFFKTSQTRKATIVHLTDDVMYYDETGVKFAFEDVYSQSTIKKKILGDVQNYKNFNSLFSCCERKLLPRCVKNEFHTMYIRFLPCEKCQRAFRHKDTKFKGVIIVPFDC